MIKKQTHPFDSVYFFCLLSAFSIFHSFFNFSKLSAISPKQITATIFLYIISYRFIISFASFCSFIISRDLSLLFFFILTMSEINHQSGQSHVIDSIYRFVNSSNEGTIVIPPTFSDAFFDPTFDPPARFA